MRRWAPRRRRVDRRVRRPGAQAERGRHAERPALADEHGAIHHRRDLAHVARPAVLRQHPHIVVRHRHRPETEAVRGALGEVLGEGADVAGTIAQRRNDDGETAEAVVEILAKRLCLDHRRQIAVRGGDDPDVDPHRPLAADAHDLTVLHDPQQADLRGERELADLVEEERAAVGLLEPPLPARRGAGECSLLVAEQLRVDELGRDRAAVDPAERSGCETSSPREWRGR